ncbi:MAG TPA: hypothetical protein EYN66_06900 [Myxococcales bacterium]|nr:hypothetical protein [Myxococcales bacterium]
MRCFGFVILVLAVVAMSQGCSGGDSDDNGSTATTGSSSTNGGTTGGIQCPEDYSPIACCKNGMMDMCCCIQEGCEEIGEYKKCPGGTCVIPEDPEQPVICP